MKWCGPTPDVVGWRRERMPDRPRGFPIQLRPDWVYEIMTDGDARRRDGLQMLRIYAHCGVPHYWLLNIERDRLTVLRLTVSGYMEVLEVGRAERVRAEPFDALELQVGEQPVESFVRVLVALLPAEYVVLSAERVVVTLRLLRDSAARVKFHRT